MTKIKDGLAGALSGKFGKFIAGIWKGIPFIKLAPEIDKDQVRSVKQIANEKKFNYTNLLLVPFHLYINIGFKNVADRKTEISAAFSLNYHNAVKGVYPNLYVDYAAFKISVGDLSNLGSPSMLLTASDSLNVTWTVAWEKKSFFNDDLMLAIYCPELQTTDGFIGKAQRSDLKCDFNFNPRFIGKELHVYISMVSQDRKRIADSMYLGKIEPS